MEEVEFIVGCYCEIDGGENVVASVVDAKDDMSLVVECMAERDRRVVEGRRRTERTGGVYQNGRGSAAEQHASLSFIFILSHI